MKGLNNIYREVHGFMGIGLWEMAAGCEGCCQAGSRTTGVRLLRWWQDGSSRISHKSLWLVWYCYVLFSHETALPTVHLLDQTHKTFKGTLFIRTKHNMQILGVIPCIKLQNETQTTVKWCKKNIWFFFMSSSVLFQIFVHLLTVHLQSFLFQISSDYITHKDSQPQWLEKHYRWVVILLGYGWGIMCLVFWNN